jgi:hypothetical protein
MTPDDLAVAFSRIGISRDYSTLDIDELEPDIERLGPDHTIFEDAIREHRPRVVIEVGTWKGASMLWMHAASVEHEIGTRFICVDTWLGSNMEIWLDPDLRASLMLEGGYPTMFRQFVVNVMSRGAEDVVYPLPMTSTAAAHVLHHLGVVADVIYIDAGHEYEEVASDIELYWPLLRPGGLMFGDDFEERWPGVERAVLRFARRHGLSPSTQQEKWLLPKPIDPPRWPRLRGVAAALGARGGRARDSAARRIGTS